MNRFQHVAVAVAASVTFSSPAVAQRADTVHLSIADAVTRALRFSDEVRLSTAESDVAEAQVISARATGLPQLRLTSTYSRAFENARAQAVGQVFNQPATYNANLNLSQTVFQGGRIKAATRAAENTRSAAQFDLQEAKSQVSVDVQRAYLQAVFLDRLVAIQSTNLELAAARLKQVEQLESAGRAARYDVLVTRVARANIEPLVIQAQSDRELALIDIKRLLNLPLDQPIVLSTTLDPSAVRAMAASADTTVTPDRGSVRAAELAAGARREAISIARADFLPSVTFTFQSGYQAFPPPGLGFPSRRGAAAESFCEAPSPGRVCQNGGWFSDRSLGMNLSWPVFDGFRAKGNLALARAQSQLADAQLQQTREAASLEVARARAELRRARSIFDARQQNAAEAAEAFQLASLRFSRGLSIQLEVSDAQLAMLTAQSGEARATTDLYLALAELARSQGQPIPTPPASVRGGNPGDAR